MKSTDEVIWQHTAGHGGSKLTIRGDGFGVHAQVDGSDMAYLTDAEWEALCNAVQRSKYTWWPPLRLVVWLCLLFNLGWQILSALRGH